MRFDSIANLLFPPICVACGRRIGNGVVCDPCFASITLHDGFSCGECHAPVEDPLVCISTCHPKFPYILGAATNYADKTVQSLVHHLKFRLIPGAAKPLAKLMENYIAHTGIDISRFVAIPIPLSPRRLRARGYNQAELITRNLNVPIATDILVRRKHAKPQSDTADAAERKKNIRDAYAISNAASAYTAIREKNILLIDDVSTSGATFLEAARTLKIAGAGKIIAIAAAKT